MNLPLDPSDRAASAVCADWLATSPLWTAATLVGAATTLAGVGLGGTPHALWPLGLLMAGERVLAVRVSLDARLFARLADGTVASTADLDTGLQRVLAVPADKTGRPLAPRIAGALRLYRLRAAAALLTAGPAVLAFCR